MKKLLLLFSIILLGLNIYSNEIYVKADASGSANGTDWDNAYTSLTAAINVASSDDIIYVAKGEYKPHANDRGQSFKIEKNIKIYGGFIGNETVTQSIIDNRDFVTNETILSGDLNGDDGDNFTNRSDNSCHVVHIQGESNSGLIANTVLDGFTISGGYADSANVNNDEGAGIYLIGNYNSVCSPILKNLVIKNNYAKKTGGGLNIGSDNGDCNPQILNCSFINNKADHGGAVNTKVIISNCGAIFNNVEFKNNSAVYDGGAVYNSADNEHTNTTNYINVLFDNNSADKGGAIFNYSNATGNFNGGTNKVIVKNATFINNNAASGSAIYNKEQDGTCEPEYTNIIVYNNKLYSSSGNNKINFSNYSTTTKPKISYSLILGSGGSGNWDNAYGIDSGNNLDADPLFVDAENSNCNLRVGSPALLAGNDGSNIGYYKGIAIENSAKTTPIITTWPAASNDISPGDTLSKAGLTTHEKSLIVDELEKEPLIEENKKVPESNIYYSEEEISTLKEKNYEQEGEKEYEIKHKLYVGGNIDNDWFSNNIEKLNGVDFLQYNEYFNYVNDLKNKKYYLIGASFKRLDKAVKLRNSLNKKGFHSIILPTKIGYYRITLRGYNQDEKNIYMQEYLEARENNQFKKAWIFVNNN